MKQMNIQTLHLVILLLVILSNTHVLAETIEYRKKGLAIDYPSGWVVHMDSRAGMGLMASMLSMNFKERTLILEDSKNDAILSIFIKPLKQEQSLKDFALSYSKQVQKNIPFGKASEGTFSPLDNVEQKNWKNVHEKIKETLQEHFSIILFDEKGLLHRRDYYKLLYPERVVYLVFQVADEDFLDMQEAFMLLLSSFKWQALKSQQ